MKKSIFSGIGNMFSFLSKRNKTVPPDTQEKKEKVSAYTDTIVITKKVIVESCTTYVDDIVYRQKCDGSFSLAITNKNKVVEPEKLLFHYSHVSGLFPDGKEYVTKKVFDYYTQGQTTNLKALREYFYFNIDSIAVIEEL